MKHALVDAQGNILRTQEFDGEAPTLAPEKGLRWIPDIKPVVDPALKTVSLVTPVPADAIEVPYLVADVDIEILRRDKMAEIQAAHNAAASANVTALGRQWRAGPLQRELITQSITLAMAGLPLPPVWIDANREPMPIGTLQDLADIAAPMNTQVNSAYAHLLPLEAAVNAAQTPAELALIVW